MLYAAIGLVVAVAVVYGVRVSKEDKLPKNKRKEKGRERAKVVLWQAGFLDEIALDFKRDRLEKKEGEMARSTR
ncbi:MAG: hypothetical protein Ct9H300mP1_23730 [Planctomycetaceae bacterium]|nr:MAG: hypothetical protein Ct9H300mP1_23730 [Planctomycetaceae bacterium]